MFGCRGTTDTRPTENRLTDQPSTIGGWARAIGWGLLAVAGCGVLLLLVGPVELVGADPQPCEQVRDQASCSVAQPTVAQPTVVQPTVVRPTVVRPTVVRPTVLPTAGGPTSQVPFARSPTP